MRAVREGPRWVWYRNGVLKAKLLYCNDLPCGQAQAWEANGAKWFEVLFLPGDAVKRTIWIEGALASDSILRPNLGPLRGRPAENRHSVSAKRASPRLPGPCVVPWIEYYQQALDLLGSGQDVEGSDFSFPPYIEIDVELDFDRDGIRDVQTSAAGWCGSRGCQVDIYVTRGRCGHHVGTIAGEPDTMQLQGESHLGLPDVVSLVREGAEKAILYRWQFDGTAYRCVSKRECQVGLGEDERGEECEPWQPPQPWSRCE